MLTLNWVFHYLAGLRIDADFVFHLSVANDERVGETAAPDSFSSSWENLTRVGLQGDLARLRQRHLGLRQILFTG